MENTIVPLTNNLVPLIIDKNSVITLFESKNVMILQDIGDNDEKINLICGLDVAKVLDLSNIHASVQNFNSDEKVIREIMTKGGPQKMLFLTSDGVYRLLFNSKKPEATIFRKWACKILNDVNFNGCREIKKALPRIENKINQSDMYTETCLYVRAQVPEKYLEKLTKEKSLNLKTVKPGITVNTRSRNSGYNNQIADNGYFIYIFQLNSRSEAEMIEKIYKFNFKDITVYGSTEYFDSELLAKKLNFNEFIPNDYDSYLQLAKVLFDHIVSLIKFNFHDYENQYGYMYTFEEKIETRLSLNILGTQEEVVTPVLVRKEIEHCQIKNEPLSFKSRSLEKDQFKIISYDLNTKLNEGFKNVEEVIKYNFISRHVFVDNILDKPRQYLGKHWRTKGNHIWIGIENLIYNDIEYKEIKSGYIKSIDSKNICQIYESITDAYVINDIKKRTLMDHIRDKTPLNGTIWTKLEISEYDNWIEDESFNIQPHNKVITNPRIIENMKINNSTQKIEVKCKEYEPTEPTILIHNDNEIIIPDDKEIIEESDDNIILPKSKDFRNTIGKVITRNLRTNEDKVYNSCTELGRELHINKTSVITQYLDQSKQVFGYHIRSFDNPVWIPPINLVYDSRVARKFFKYIMSIDSKNSKITKIYENQSAACDILGYPDRSSLKYPLKNGTIYDKKYWIYYEKTPGKFENVKIKSL